MAEYEERPTAAFTLSVIGLALHAIAAVYLVSATIYGSSFWGGGMFAGPTMMGPWMMMGGPWFFGFGWLPFTAVFGVLIIVLGVLGTVWLNTSDLRKIRSGATLVLITSIIAFPTMFGFMIGSLLMFIGSLVGLTWRPTRRM